jgi:hypothetical protein
LSESSSIPTSKDDKQSTLTSNNSSQSSQETNGKNTDSNKSIERQPTQKASSSNGYTALNTQDEVR